MQINMEQHRPKPIQQRAKSITKKNTTMVFHNEKEQLYLGRDALGVGLGAGLLKVRDGMQFQRNEAPNNAALWPIVFMKKSLTSTETQYTNIEREVLSILLVV